MYQHSTYSIYNFGCIEQESMIDQTSERNLYDWLNRLVIISASVSCVTQNGYIYIFSTENDRTHFCVNTPNTKQYTITEHTTLLRVEQRFTLTSSQLCTGNNSPENYILLL